MKYEIIEVLMGKIIIESDRKELIKAENKFKDSISSLTYWPHPSKIGNFKTNKTFYPMP